MKRLVKWFHSYAEAKVLRDTGLDREAISKQSGRGDLWNALSGQRRQLWRFTLIYAACVIIFCIVMFVAIFVFVTPPASKQPPTGPHPQPAHSADPALQQQKGP